MKATDLVIKLVEIIRHYPNVEVCIPPGQDSATGESNCPLIRVLYHKETNSVRLEGELGENNGTS